MLVDMGRYGYRGEAGNAASFFTVQRLSSSGEKAVVRSSWLLRPRLAAADNGTPDGQI